MDDLMRERGHIRESGRVADEILGQAAEAAEALQRQQQMVAGTRGKLGVFDSVVHSAGDVIGKIKWKRRKNSLVTAGTIALCLFFLFWWWWSS